MVSSSGLPWAHPSPLLTKQLQRPGRGPNMSSQKRLEGQGLREQFARQRSMPHRSHCTWRLASILAVFARTLSWGYLTGCDGQQVPRGQRKGSCQSRLAELARKDLNMTEAKSSGTIIYCSGILIPHRNRQADTSKHLIPSNTHCMLSEKVHS